MTGTRSLLLALCAVVIIANNAPAQDLPWKIVDTTKKTKFYYITVGDNRQSPDEVDLNFSEEDWTDHAPCGLFRYGPAR